MSKFVGMLLKNSYREIYSTQHLYQKRMKVTNQLPKLLPQETKKEIITIRAEVNEIENRETAEKNQ